MLYSRALLIASSLLLPQNRAGVPSFDCLESTPGFHLAGMDQEVEALRVFDDGTGSKLYAGGMFSRVGGVAASAIAAFDGTRWSPLGSGIMGAAAPNMPAEVTALETFDAGSGPELYAGGWFTMAGGVPAAGLARWNGATWSAVAHALTHTTFGDGGLQALAVFDDGGGPALYAGGSFTHVDGVPANNIAKWNGTSWSPLGSGVSGAVWALASFDDGSGSALYASGGFQAAGGAPAQFVARWDGSAWSPLANGTFGGGFALAAFDDGSGPALYVGGNFQTASGVVVNHIAKWDGSNWSALDGGANGAVRSLAVLDDGSGPALHAGGTFTEIGGLEARCLARWDGASWSGLGSGMEQSVGGMASYDDGSGSALYFAGLFQGAGDAPARRIAKWTNGAWAQVGDGNGTSSTYNNPNSVSDLQTFDDGNGSALYAVGEFQSSGGVLTGNVARFDGASWSPLGRGASNGVSALAVHDDGTGEDLYVAGAFFEIDGILTSRVARWDGANWSPLGNGFDDTVNDLVSADDGSGPTLFAAGVFSQSGSTPTRNVAKWDGSAWLPMGSGVDGSAGHGGGIAACILGYDDGNGPNVYVGGSISVAGGVPVSNIARWNGTSWSALGSGLQNGTPKAMLVVDGKLYVCGSFDSAGGVPGTAGIATWDGAGWASAGGLGPNTTFGALATFDDGGGRTLFAAIESFVGGDYQQRFARLEGSTWSILPVSIDSGLPSDRVNALAEFHDLGGRPSLFVGGKFAKAGNIEAVNLAALRRCSTTRPLRPGSLR